MQPHATEFFLKEDPDQANVYIKARGNLSVEAEDELVRKVEQQADRHQGRRGDRHPGRPAARRRRPATASRPNDTIGRIQCSFVDYDTRKEAAPDRQRTSSATVRKRLDRDPRRADRGAPAARAARPRARTCRSSCAARTREALNKAADLVRAHLAADPQIVELEDTRTSPGIQWNFTVDRVAAGRYGVDVLSVGQAIEFVTDGVLAGKIRPDDSRDELDIRVRFPPEARNIAAFDHLKINTPLGPGAGELLRQDGARPSR